MKFSIITPSYNQAEFLEETIKSIVSQKVDLEYFIQDGGSTDGSVDIIKKYSGKYPFITWQSKKDKGQANALNQGLKKCSGNIIAYLNSDDYYLPGALQKVEKYFNSHPKKKWVVGDCRVSNPKLSWTFFLKHLWPINVNPWFLKIFNTINQPSVFLKRELIEKVGRFDESLSYAFDYDYWLRCLTIVGTPGRLKETLSVFRIQPKSKGNTSFVRQFQEDYRIICRYEKNKIFSCLHLIISRVTILFYYILKK